MKTKTFWFVLAVASAGLVLSSTDVQSASRTWDGGSLANGHWGTQANWNSGISLPGSTTVTNNMDVATFNAAIVNTWGVSAGNPVVIDSPTQNIGGISFTTAAGNYFIGSTGGNTIRLSSGGSIEILAALTATNAVETINAPLSIQGSGGTYTFANNSASGSGANAGTLNFGGSISGAVAGATVLNLNGSNTNANTISGLIGNGNATTLSLNKSGVGTWELTGTSTYTGNTVVSAGTLRVNGALGDTDLTVGAGATLGGTGSLGGDLLLDSGALLNIVDIGDALSVGGNVTFSGFGFSNITGWNYAAADVGTYTLLSGSNINLANVSNVGVGNPLDFGNGKLGYFQTGGLQVVVIPEPSALLLLSLGSLGLALRRRK